ncbi:MAG TPA: DUF1850 domain-containing protein [Methylomirabilota bacterium]|nr:DUF1850 domain-containing protein [Methylomirabilota bacterium]
MARPGRLLLALVTAALGAAAAGAWPFCGLAGPALVVTEARSGRVLLFERAAPGTRFTLSYFHSVSRTRVSGVFEIARDGRLIVRETSFGTFGPGLPELGPGDRYELKGGAIRQYSLDQPLSELSFFVHPYTEHRVEVAGRALYLSGSLPAGTLVRISVRR